MKYFLITLCWGCALGTASAAVAASATPVPAISLGEARSLCDGANKQFTVGLSQGNPVAIASLYASDALLQAPGGTEPTRRDGIAAFWQRMIDEGSSGLAMSIDAVAVEGEILIETGRYALIAGQVGVVETGKYLIVRRREAGQWRIFRHIWNANQASSSTG